MRNGHGRDLLLHGRNRGLVVAVRAVGRTVRVFSESFWVSGLALLSVLGVNRCVIGPPELKEWAGYLLLGTLFPAVVLGMCAAARWAFIPLQTHAILRALLAGAFTVVSISYLARYGSVAVLWASIGQALVVIVAAARREDWSRVRQGAVSPEGVALALSAVLVLPLAWTIAARLVYWSPLDGVITRSASSLALFCAALVLVASSMFRGRARRDWSSIHVRRASRYAGIVVIALFAFNTVPLLSSESSFDHWAWASGPAQLVRQGGWLLFDVQATYGFLSTLAVAWFPTESTWQALYVVNSGLLLASSVFIFWLYRKVWPGSVGSVAAFLIAISAVFLMPGLAERLTGVQRFPSVGAFRFFWCFVLLGILYWNYARPAMNHRLRKVALAGSTAWLFGSLWSAESAAYCTAIWIPAYLLILGQWFGPAGAEAERSSAAIVRGVAAWLLLPLLLMLGALTAICSYYLLRLGHFPDLLAHFEAALAFTSGFNVKPINPSGRVWVLVLVFCTIATFGAYLLRRGRGSLSGLSLIAGLFGAIWATASYFVPHSDRTQVLNLAPIYCAAIGILLLLFSTHSSRDSHTIALIKIAVMPILTMVVIVTVGHPMVGSFLRQSYIRYANGGAFVFDVGALIPLEGPELHELLDRAHVKPGEPITSLQKSLLGRIEYRAENGRHEILTEHPAFLPIKPAWALQAARREFVERFVTRWIERREPRGWLLVPKQHARLPWLRELLARTHTPTRVVTSAGWDLMWMEPIEAPENGGAG